MNLIIGLTKKCNVHFNVGRIVRRDSTTSSGIITARTIRYIDIGTEDDGTNVIYFAELLWLRIYIEVCGSSTQSTTGTLPRVETVQPTSRNSGKIIAFKRPKQLIAKRGRYEDQ